MYRVICEQRVKCRDCKGVRVHVVWETTIGVILRTCRGCGRTEVTREHRCSDGNGMDGAAVVRLEDGSGASFCGRCGKFRGFVRTAGPRRRAASLFDVEASRAAREGS